MILNMLESFGDQEENPRKDSIAAKSPMLKIFIDKYAESDTDLWEKMLWKVIHGKREEILS